MKKPINIMENQTKKKEDATTFISQTSVRSMYPNLENINCHVTQRFAARHVFKWAA